MSKRNAAPWCPSCEWNLDAYERRHGIFGWRVLDRAHHRIAFRLNDQQYTALADRPLDKNGAGFARYVTMAIGALMLTGIVALLAVGAWLLVAEPITLSWLLGLLSIMLAVMLRPRFGRLKKVLEFDHEASREKYSELFALIERVAMAAGTPMPHIVVLNASFNAATTAAGLRRRRVLILGLPLWASLDPQERVALLGHELGHFVNGDIRRLPLLGVALTTFGRLADVLQPMNFRGRNVWMILASLITKPVLWVVSRLLICLHLGMLWLGLRDQQRAEYYADEMAAKVAGTAAVVGLLDHLLVDDAIQTVVRREARAGKGADAWLAAARVADVNLRADLPLLRQLDRRRRASLFVSHPPSGRRADMLDHRTPHPGTVQLDEITAAKIENELAAQYERTRRDLLDWRG